MSIFSSCKQEWCYVYAFRESLQSFWGSYGFIYTTVFHSPIVQKTMVLMHSNTKLCKHLSLIRMGGFLDYKVLITNVRQYDSAKQQKKGSRVCTDEHYRSRIMLRTGPRIRIRNHTNIFWRMQTFSPRKEMFPLFRNSNVRQSSQKLKNCLYFIFESAMGLAAKKNSAIPSHLLIFSCMRSS